MFSCDSKGRELAVASACQIELSSAIIIHVRCRSHLNSPTARSMLRINMSQPIMNNNLMFISLVFDATEQENVILYCWQSTTVIATGIII